MAPKKRQRRASAPAAAPSAAVPPAVAEVLLAAAAAGAAPAATAGSAAASGAQPASSGTGPSWTELEEEERAPVAAPTAAAPTAAPNAADGGDSDANSEYELAEEHDDDAQPDDEAAAAPAAAPAANDWVRDDDFSMSQRVKTLGDDLQYGPKLNLDGYASKGIFDYAKFFLPMTYLGHLAAMMQANGKARHDRKIPGYTNWTVTVDDVLQW